MKSFEYHEPETVEEATGLLSRYGGKAQILAGGIDLIPRMRRGDLEPEHIINIQNIEGLGHINPAEGGGITFGAAVKLRSIEVSAVIWSRYPILYEAIHQIASVQTKYMGTAAGNLCVATPASDLATALLALGANLKIAGRDGERSEPLEKFYVDYRLTSLDRSEMVTQVMLPGPRPGTGTAFLNLVRTHADIAKIIVAASMLVENGICREARIAIGAAAPTVMRPAKAENSLVGREIRSGVIENAAEMAAEEIKPMTDLRSTAGYRREMTRVLVERALERALQRVNHTGKKRCD